MKNNHIQNDLELQTDQLIRHLEIIKNYTLLEDEEELIRAVEKLKIYNIISEVQQIIDKIQEKEYGKSINLIQDLIGKHQQLTFWKDPEISALKLEIIHLENKLNELTLKKIELEKILSEFEYRQSVELGEIILKILKMKKQKYKSDEQKYKEAERDEKQYREQIKHQKSKKFFKLGQNDQKELKEKFRKASKLCHPDKVSEEFQELARQTFIELKEAYNVNDLDTVSKILSKLEKGYFFNAKSETISEKEILISHIKELKHQIQNILTEIQSISEDRTYKMIIILKDWDEYFRKTREELSEELEFMKNSTI